MTSDAQTAYSLALCFGLVTDEGLRARLADRLAELVRGYAYRIGTGFVGTPLVLEALSSTGHADAAFRMLLEDGCPSWLYPVRMGSTTIWERWDSMLPDGSVNPGEMTSFNHYALGAVADWMHRVIGGIALAEPGGAVVEIAPVPSARVRSARATLDTGYGQVEVRWRWQEGAFRLDAVIPPNSSARVRLPGDASPRTVGSGRHCWEVVLAEPVAAPFLPSLDSTLGEIADDPQAREVLLAACAREDFLQATLWALKGGWRGDLTVRDAMTFPSAAAVARVGRALDTLAEERRPG